MIKYPQNWNQIGQKVTLNQLDFTMLQIITDLDCDCLSLSGGIDSSLLLYYMVRIFGKNVKCYTFAKNQDHPDYIFANLVARIFGVDCIINVPDGCLKRRTGDFQGDEIIRNFYNTLANNGIKRIIAGDGIDEFMGGYYAHMGKPTEETYYDYLRKLQEEQLEPLNRNSAEVEVLLPYLDKRIIYLLAQIPLSEKVDTQNRKKVILKLAKGRIPNEILERRKYGFVDAMIIKENK